MDAKIWYGDSEVPVGNYRGLVQKAIVESGAKRVLDVGGGANPLLDEAFIRLHELDYSVLDISRSELEKAPDHCTKIVADAASPEFAVEGPFDAVFSMFFLEHIKDPEQFHKNMLSVLAEGGLSIHLFPTLFAPPFVVNLLLPEGLTSSLLNRFDPRDRHQYDKFPAYYKWCHGPTKAQLARFRRLGYEVAEYGGLFGHGGYYRRIKFLKAMHAKRTAQLIARPNPRWTSYAYLVLKKA